MPSTTPVFKSTEVTDVVAARENWTGVSAPGYFTPGGKLRYAFSLVESASQIINPNQQVVLHLSPQAISQDEPAATNIVYTQNSGKWVERKGQLSKTITLSGTTGFNPEPQFPSGLRRTLPQALIVAGEAPKSGFARFLELRNIFRRYWEHFSGGSTSPEEQKNIKLIFSNEKDDETWLVEPMSFRMTRQSPRNKFTYQYDITLQTIAPLEAIKIDDDPLTLLQRVDGIRQILRTTAQTITGTIGVLGATMAFASGLLADAVGLVTNTLDGIAGQVTQLADGTISFITEARLIKRRLTNAADNFYNAFENLEDVREALLLSQGTDPVPFAADQALITAALEIALLAGRTELYSQDIQTNWQKTLDDYNPNYGFGGYNVDLVAPLTRSGVRESSIQPNDNIFSLALRELGNVERYQEIVVLNNLKPPYLASDTNSRAPRTLAPGDAVLLPTTAPSSGAKSAIVASVFADPVFIGDVLTGGATTSIVDTSGKTWRPDQWVGFTASILSGTGSGQERKIIANTANTFTVDASWGTIPTTSSVVRFFLRRLGAEPKKKANEQLLGVDLRLQELGFRGGRTLLDIQASASGDLRLVDGTDNAKQFINIKFNTRSGGLPAHPAFGLPLGPGGKMNVDSLVLYRAGVRQMLKIDPRIERVENLKVTGRGDVLELEGHVTLTGQSQPFSVDARGVA